MLSVCGSPGRGTLSRSFSRRQVLVVGLTAGAAALVGAPLAGAAPAVAVWGLDPDAGRDGCGCSGCAACQAHAANKIFASAADADAGRAHPRCRCVVTQLDSVESSVYDALFADGGSRPSVDRRWQWVQAVLVQAAPATTQPVAPPPVSVVPAPVASTPGPGIDLTEPLDVWPTPALAPGPTLRSAWVVREGPARRVLFVQIQSTLPVETSVGLAPGVVANGLRPIRRRLPAGSGRRTLRIPLAASLPHGPARLRLKFRDADGRTRHATRLVSIPARQPRPR